MTQEAFAKLDAAVRMVVTDRKLTHLSARHLAILFAAKDRPGIGCAGISDRLHISKPSVTRGVSILVGKGLITNMTDPVDRRMRKVAVTEQGEALVDQIAAEAA